MRAPVSFVDCIYPGCTSQVVARVSELVGVDGYFHEWCLNHDPHDDEYYDMTDDELAEEML